MEKSKLFNPLICSHCFNRLSGWHYVGKCAPPKDGQYYVYLYTCDHDTAFYGNGNRWIRNGRLADNEILAWRSLFPDPEFDSSGVLRCDKFGLF